MPAPKSLSPFTLRMLGSTELRGPDGWPVDALLAQPKRLALLAYLVAARPTGFRRREQLLLLFWPELDERRARSALSQALHRLRLALGEAVLVARGVDEVGVEPSALQCDVVALDRALVEGRVSDALTLYRGDLLPGFALPDAPDFEEWLDAERRSLRERVAAVAGSAAGRAEAEGRLDDAVALARRALELAPLDEVAVRRAMALLARAGDPAGAVRCHDEFAERLHRELELAPSAETAALLAKVRAPRASARAAPPPMPSVPPLDLLPPPSPAPPRAVPGVSSPRPARWAWGWLAAATVAFGVIAALASRRGVARASAPEAVRRVAVLPFVVRGDSTLGFLSEGMVDLLSASIEGLADVQAADPNAVLARSPSRDSTGAVSPEDGAMLARRVGASRFVLGEVIALSGRLRAVAVLYDSTGRRLDVLRAEAPNLAELPAAVDDLARQVVANQLSAPAERLSRLATLTTDSLVALRLFLDGERHLRRGQFERAAQSFRGAVASDSAFALAWFRLGVALEWVAASSAERRRATERALAGSARLTERDRMLVRAYHAYAYGDLDEAESLYRRLVTQFPEDVEAWYGLADVQFHAGPLRGRPLQEAEPAFRRLLALHPAHLEGQLHLLRLVAPRAPGADPAQFDSLLATVLPAIAADPLQRLRLEALRALAVRDTPAVAAVVAAAASLPAQDLYELGASLASMTGNLEGAAAILSPLVSSRQPARWRAIGRMALAQLALGAGRWEATRVELAALAREDSTLALFVEAALATEPWLPLAAGERDSVRARLAAWEPAGPSPVLAGTYPMFPAMAPSVRLFDLALLAAFAGDPAASARHRAELSAVSPLERPIPGDWALGVVADAAMALQQGRAGAALAALEGAHPSPSLLSFPRTYVVTHGLERWTRAEALRRAGREREALDWYGSFTCYLCLMDVPLEAPGWLRQGAIREALGERVGARRAYGLVLERWRHADARFAPLLDSARAGLARTGSAR